MGMPTLGVYLLLATLVTPSMVEVGIPPMAAHLFALYFGMLSLITPPVAVAAFTAATVAESDFLRTGFAAVHFGWTAYVVPFLFVLAPELLMEGSALEIIHTAATAVIGVWLVSAGFGLFRQWDSPARAFLGRGPVVVLSGRGVSYGIWTDVAGACLAGVLVVTGGFRGERGRPVTRAGLKPVPTTPLSGCRTATRLVSCAVISWHKLRRIFRCRQGAMTSSGGHHARKSNAADGEKDKQIVPGNYGTRH